MRPAAEIAWRAVQLVARIFLALWVVANVATGSPQGIRILACAGAFAAGLVCAKVTGAWRRAMAMRRMRRWLTDRMEEDQGVVIEDAARRWADAATCGFSVTGPHGERVDPRAIGDFPDELHMTGRPPAGAGFCGFEPAVPDREEQRP